jgi:hypothetical protein
MNENCLTVRLYSFVAILAAMIYLSGIAMAQPPKKDNKHDGNKPVPEHDTFDNDGSDTFENSPTPTFTPEPPRPEKKENKGKKDKGDDGGVMMMQTALPDLKFSSVVVTPVGDVAGGSGVTGQAATITVTISNGGSGSAGEFRLDVWKHLPSPPNFGSIGDFSQTFPSLAGNTSMSVSYSFTMANSYGTYFPRSTVDSLNQVTETSEVNNTNTGSCTVIEMATVVPPTINTVSGASVVFRGVAKPYGKKWPVNQPSAVITVPGVGSVTVPHNGTATLAGVGTFGPIVKNLIGDASLTCELAPDFVGAVATITFVCGTSTASGELRSVGLNPVVPSVAAIGRGTTIALSVTTNPQNSNWPTGQPTVSLTPSNAGTLGTLVKQTGTATVTFFAHPDFVGQATVTFQCGSESSSATIHIMDTSTVDWHLWGDNTGSTTLNGGGLYIYADKDAPGDAVVPKPMAIKIQLNAPLPPDTTLTVFYKIVDVDDPTQHYLAAQGTINQADPNDTAPDVFMGNDNRSSVLDGTLTGISPPTAIQGSITFLGGSISAIGGTMTIDPPQPGNNWKFVAGFVQSRVNAVELNTAVSNGENSVLSFKWADGSVVAINYQSQLLSVWRRLHVEIDSMAAVPSFGSQSNFASALITAMPTGANSATISIGAFWPLDPSPNLSGAGATLGNGRFENGTVTVGNSPSTTTSSPLLGNGSDFLRAPAGQRILVPFVLFPEAGSGISPLVGFLDGFINNTASLGVTLTQAYNNGTLVVVDNHYNIGPGGAPVGSNVVTTSTFITVPFTVVDDDDFSLVPTSVAAGTNTALLDVLVESLRKAYIRALDDGGGNPANNGSTTPFRLNLPGTPNDDDAFTRQAAGSNDFWVAYILLGYQWKETRDGDPNSEDSILGGTWAEMSNSAVTRGGNGSHVFLETVVDRRGATSFNQARSTVFAHEVGHQLGLMHWDVATADEPTGIPVGTVVPVNLMRRLLQDMLGNPHFVEEQIKLLRYRVQSPHRP